MLCEPCHCKRISPTCLRQKHVHTFPYCFIFLYENISNLKQLKIHVCSVGIAFYVRISWLQICCFYADWTLLVFPLFYVLGSNKTAVELLYDQQLFFIGLLLLEMTALDTQGLFLSLDRASYLFQTSWLFLYLSWLDDHNLSAWPLSPPWPPL